MAEQALKTIAGFSGGKDSTAMVLQLHPKYLLFTPTGNELPEVYRHIKMIAEMVGAKVITPKGPSLADLIAHYNAVPNPRMRWCTRQIKIQPAIAWMRKHEDFRLAVGLRADEETRDGIYGLPLDRYFCPMREWAWGLREVEHCLEFHGIRVPKRTDCAVCPYQRLGEWWRLWKHHAREWAKGEAWEAQTGHTFRMPSRDTWPAALVDLRRRFEAGDKPRGADSEETGSKCRVCSL